MMWKLLSNGTSPVKPVQEHLPHLGGGRLRDLIVGSQLLLEGILCTGVHRGMSLPEVAPVAPLDGIENYHLRKLIQGLTSRLLPHLLTVLIMRHTGQSTVRLM